MTAAETTGPTHGSPARGAARTAWWLILAAAVFRVLYVAAYPLDLAGDEAYYWDWSRRLALGYFSKPPLIAWLMAAVSAIGGSHTVTIRIAAALIGTGSLILLFQLTRSLFGGRAGLLAVLLALAMPGNVLLSQMLTIDAPLVFFWSASLILFWRWHRREQPFLSATLLTLALGCGYLSKQMMLVFPGLAIVFLLTGAEGRRSARRPGFWIAAAVSLLFLLPPLIWNARNDWITFRHTGHHFEGSEASTPFYETFFAHLGSQAGVLSPLIWFLVMALALTGLAAFFRLGEKERFLIVFSAPMILAVTLMSLRQTILPNWPAVSYIAILALLAGWLAESSRAPGMPEKWRALLKPALMLGFVMVAVAYLLPPALEAVNLDGHRKLDPMRRLRGHDELAARAEEFLKKAPRPDKTFILAQGHRYHASELAFYLPGQPRVYRWESRDRIASQYEIWPDPIADGKRGWDALVFYVGRDRSVPRRLSGAFDTFERLGEVAVEVSPYYELYYEVFLGHSMNEWPPGKPVEPGNQPTEE